MVGKMSPRSSNRGKPKMVASVFAVGAPVIRICR